MAYAALKTHEGEVGLLPAGLHGYGAGITRPTTGWRPSYKIALGTYHPMDFPLPAPSTLGDFTSELNTILDDATSAFESTQPSAVAEATYGGGAIAPGAQPAAAGSISFGGNTGMILVVLGVAALALFSPGGRKRR